jgi:hypothetical protein
MPSNSTSLFFSTDHSLVSDCCFNELAPKNPIKYVGLVQGGPHHHLIEYDIAEIRQSLTH